jgi:hypothetical protein
MHWRDGDRTGRQSVTPWISFPDTD